ncbi:hypothetical protein HUJ05_002867 [Dendroctonus ponderosae]|nr:hypothetical protein HUJ05_002867 [Dendroctonus ponderosae]
MNSKIHPGQKTQNCMREDIQTKPQLNDNEVFCESEIFTSHPQDAIKKFRTEKFREFSDANVRETEVTNLKKLADNVDNIMKR